MNINEKIEIFKKYKVKNTKQRNAVLDVLISTEIPISAEQIFLKIKEYDHTASLSTVYRILDIFIEKDMVLKTILHLEHKAVFEFNRHEHKHHLVCTGCKTRFVIDECPLKMFEKSLEKFTQFQITGHRLEVFGQCSACRAFN